MVVWCIVYPSNESFSHKIRQSVSVKRDQSQQYFPGRIYVCINLCPAVSSVRGSTAKRKEKATKGRKKKIDRGRQETYSCLFHVHSTIPALTVGGCKADGRPSISSFSFFVGPRTGQTPICINFPFFLDLHNDDQDSKHQSRENVLFFQHRAREVCFQYHMYDVSACSLSLQSEDLITLEIVFNIARKRSDSVKNVCVWCSGVGVRRRRRPTTHYYTIPERQKKKHPINDVCPRQRTLHSTQYYRHNTTRYYTIPERLNKTIPHQ